MDKSELLKIINEASKPREKFLNLSGEGITSLPPEIGQLTSLVELNLNGNELVSFPPEIGQLTNLEKLWLDSNELISLPPKSAS